MRSLPLAFVLLVGCAAPTAPPVPSPPVAAAPASKTSAAPGRAPGATSRGSDAKGAVAQESVADLKAALDSGAWLLDVRTPGEFATGHVPGATNVPLAELGAHLAELQARRDEPVHVICQSGGRSAAASGVLQDAGFAPINVLGGTLAWKAAGYPVQ